MPVHDQGYRRWDDPRVDGLRWWVIAETGIRLAWKSHWLRRMLMLAWLPAIGLGLILFVYERSVVEPRMRVLAFQLVRLLPNSDALWGGLGPLVGPEGMRLDGETMAEPRPQIWGFILLTLFRYPQGALMVMLVGLIAPSLIAQDVRSRAFLLYFSRPILRSDYVLGKSVVIWVYLSLITTLPAMALYLLGVFLSPSLTIVLHTWDLPLRIIAASLWLILPTTAISLCLSSLTTESRYAAFGWFGIWILGWVAYINLNVMDLGSRMFDQPSSFNSRWTLVSLYHSMGIVQSWIFGVEDDWSRVLPPLLFILLVTAAAMMILLRRVSAPMRI